jgi:hypothetical protein
MASPLHKYLSVGDEYKAKLDNALSAAKKLFTGSEKEVSKKEVFDGMTRVYEPLDAADVVGLPPESKNVAMTVPAVLNDLGTAMAKLFTYEATKDEANCRAKADIVVDGHKLAEHVPAQTLLTLERLWRSVKSCVTNLPTLDPTLDWSESTVKDVWKHGPVKKNRTTKKMHGVTLHEGNDKHPPQVQAVTEDVVIGQYLTTMFSGAIQSDAKSMLLDRIDKIIVAVKQAREEANRVEVSEARMDKMVKYALYGATD